MWYISEPNTKNSRYTAFQAERILRSSRRGALGREQSLPTLCFQKFLPSVTIFQFYLESYIFKTTLSLVTFQTMLTRWQKKKINILACCTLSSSTNKSRHKISTHFISKTTLHILVLKYMLSLKSYFRCVEFWQLQPYRKIYAFITIFNKDKNIRKSEMMNQHKKCHKIIQLSCNILHP